MNQHQIHQMELLEQLDAILERLDPDHLARAQEKVQRSVTVRKRQAREQALDEVREISRRYGIPLREIVEQA